MTAITKLNLKPETCVVQFSEIAEELAEATSYEQVIFLHEFFDAIRHLCGSRFESQLLFMSDEMKRSSAFDDLIRSLSTLNAFLNTVSEGPKE